MNGGASGRARLAVQSFASLIACFGWKVAIEFLRARASADRSIRDIYPGAIMSPAEMGTLQGWERGPVDSTSRRGTLG
jgi:hypothetical protein